MKSDSFPYTAKSESGSRVLVLSAEDYTGISPVYKKAAPQYLSYYLDSLAANGIAADVYDVDAMGRMAPSPLGVLSHYDAVVWYTGDDIITRDVGMAAGTASRLANDELLAVRQYIDEGGKLLYTGKYAGLQYAQGYEYDLEHNLPCDANSTADGCIALADDFLQYYLGAYAYNEDAGTTANGKLYDALGVRDPFTGLSWAFGGNAAGNQDHGASFLATSGILPAATYPQFNSWASVRYNRPGGPFSPHTGARYAYSQIADVSYKRLTRTVDLTGRSSGSLSFWMSNDTEADWDFVFVEAHTVGKDDWTTLPDRNGHTSQSTGPNDPDLASCPAGWIEQLHPWLAHYQTHNADDTCTPSGTTGVWNATSGNSNGWASGRSTSPHTRARRSRSRSRTRPTGRRRGSVSSSTTPPFRQGRPRRSRTASAAGRCRARLWVAPRTRMTGSRRPLTASPKAPRSRHPTRSTSGSGSRGSRRRRHGMP